MAQQELCLGRLCPWGGAAADPGLCCPQSEPEGFSHFHLYVCAAFLIKWRKEILDEEDFQVSPRGWEQQGGSWLWVGAQHGHNQYSLKAGSEVTQPESNC